MKKNAENLFLTKGNDSRKTKSNATILDSFHQGTNDLYLFSNYTNGKKETVYCKNINYSRNLHENL